MRATDGIQGDVRFVLGLLDEVERVSPGMSRIQIVRRFTKQRNFEAQLIEGRVSMRRLAVIAGKLSDWLGRFDG